MDYIDSGVREENQALGYWLNAELTKGVAALRWQSGYFSLDGMALFFPVIEKLINQDAVVRGLIGANEHASNRAEVEQLMKLLGLPDSSAMIGVVSYTGGLFHPKTYHITRQDGTQAAYVGSANLTSPGFSGLNIEAGIILDTRNGDPEDLVTRIAKAVDDWFDEERDGLTILTDSAVLDKLEKDGVLLSAPSNKIKSKETSASGGYGKPALAPLFKLPKIKTAGIEKATTAVKQAKAVLPSVPKSDFPHYLLFDPSATSATEGVNALTGTTLPGGAVGLVVRLNKDSARHFAGRPGTANVSIPVPTLSTIRFGIYRGKYKRPRAEFGLELRYVSTHTILQSPYTTTNIMAYGFLPGEVGHGDVRMVIPAVARYLAALIDKEGLVQPRIGDPAFLEWPTTLLPMFRLSFLEPDSPIFSDANEYFADAEDAHELVGAGACWLPSGITPPW